jgi:ribosomal peptide maturation radical SAM protein 1
VQKGFKLIGCSTSFQQTSVSVALLNYIKYLCPETVTFVGGSNCEGEMAEGIASLNTSIDYIFSGESETSFPNFLKQVMSGNPPLNRIIKGSPCINLDAIPTPSHKEYFKQLKYYSCDVQYQQNKKDEGIWLAYETSRGCWWGQKQQCTFCGLNGTGIKFREKSPDRVIAEIKKLVAESPTRKIITTDNIMPYTYFQTLIPRLGKEIPNLYIHYEQKSNLTLEKVIALKEAGITEIQPGIEALSSSLLTRMKKGVSASQNIALLRYCRSAKVIVKWNLLWGFPGDKLFEYEETLKLLPLLRHLQPPTGLYRIVVDRFSPYFEKPDAYGVTNIRPSPMYASFLPSNCDINKLAYHFVADYHSESIENSDLIRDIRIEQHNWRNDWFSNDTQHPVLTIQSLSDNVFLLIDSRGLPATEEVQFLNFEEALVALCGSYSLSTSEAEWALERKLVVELDDRYVPLVTAEPEVLQKFEEVHRHMRLEGLGHAKCNY